MPNSPYGFYPSHPVLYPPIPPYGQNQHQGSGQSNLVQVYNRQSVDSYYVAPNTQTIFVYENEPIIAIKRADAAGATIVNEYDLVPHQSAQQQAYVTKEEFQALVDRMNHYESIAQQPVLQSAAQPAILNEPTPVNAS